MALFRTFFANQKQNKSNIHKTNTKKENNKKNKKHQTKAGLGELGPKEKAKITKGDLKDKTKTENQENKKLIDENNL